MPEFLTKISNQLTEFWNRFNTKRKIQIIATFAIAIIALVVLVAVLNQPTYILLEKDLEANDINAIKTQLEASDITYRVGADGESVEVLAGTKTDAILALADVGIISSDDMTYTELFNNSLMTSDSEKAIKYQEFTESELARTIEIIESISDAQVGLVLPDMSRTVLDDQKQSKASVIITTTEDISEKIVSNIAKWLANRVENLEVANITIIDSIGQLLFDGGSVSGDLSSISGGQEYEYQKEQVVKNNVRSILLSGGEYNDATVTVDLVIDYDQLESQSESHTTQDGSSTGIISEENLYETESTNTSVSGEPGTGTNDGVTDTMIDEGNDSSAVTSETVRSYVYDTKVESAIKAIGGVVKDESVVSVSLKKYKYYNQELLEAQADGPLVDKTWEQYKFEIQEIGNVRITEIDEAITNIVKTASNLDNVNVVAYEVPKFIEKEVSESQLSEYLLIGIIVVMILLLGYAVYRGTEPIEIKEIEPELSVEDMLATTKESSDVGSIEFDGKSDARVQIESFVENNPDAVALLLRNWLNEDWE